MRLLGRDRGGVWLLNPGRSPVSNGIEVANVGPKGKAVTSRVKKRVFNTLRIVLCVAALVIVIQGVTVDDHVTLKTGEPDLVGRVVEEPTAPDQVVVDLADGRSRRIDRADIAVDSHGNLRIAYGLKTAWRKSSPYLLWLAVAIHFVVVFPQTLRFKWLLGAQDIRVGYWECLKLTFAGNFLNFVTPLGSHAGDVFKAYFVSLHTEHKTEAVTTVLLDRLIGLTSVLLIVATITTFSPSDSRLAQFRPYFLSFLGAGVLVVVVYLSPTVRRHFVPRAWLSRLPMFDQLQRIDKTARGLAGSKATVGGAILLTMFLQCLAIGAYFTVAVALAMKANLGNVLEYYTYFFTGVLVQTLPGPPQGLGTVELTYRYFLAPFGSPSQIVCVAFFIRLVALTCALPGLLVTLTGSYRPADVKEVTGVSAGHESDSAAAQRDLAVDRP